MIDGSTSNSEYWRDSARIVRIKADKAKGQKTKHMLRGIADSYERLAEQLEQRSHDTEK